MVVQRQGVTPFRPAAAALYFYRTWWHENRSGSPSSAQAVAHLSTGPQTSPSSNRSVAAYATLAGSMFGAFIVGTL